MVTTGSQSVDAGSLVVAASAVFVVIGAFLGWFTVPVGDAVSSIDGLELYESGSPIFNGVVTITLATIVTVLALFVPDVEIVNVLIAIAGLGVELIAVAFVVAPDVALGETIAAIGDVSLSSTGTGVIVTIVGGLGIMLGGVLSYRR